ncbi:MAG: L,D-transpeptidase family protein [Sulfurovum sp.]|nr:L,D-transpeptidase family protein [Sulfurovum sp.]
MITKIKNKIFDKLAIVGMVLMLWTAPQAAASLVGVEFHEAASDIMINSLQTQPQNSFLRKMYTQLFFVPVWINERSLSSFAQELFVQIKEDETLDHSTRLYGDMLELEEKAKKIYESSSTLAHKVDLEFKIAQLYKGYADYALYGSINWGAFQARLSNLKTKDIGAAWVTHKPKESPVSLIESALMNGSLKEGFRNAMPNEYHYKELRRALIQYLKIQRNGGWPPVPLNGTLAVGQSYKAVPYLRERLRATGDYQGCSGSRESTIYDNCLKEAVVRFQKRNGLEAKGIIGQATIKALNQSIERRIATMRLNLDRIKWFKERNEKRHIIINIPAFSLYFEEDGKLRQEMGVITGTRKNPTPIFSNRVKQIVLNPYWNVPESIIQKEMIPKLLRNANAMAREKIEIHSGWGEDDKKINPASVDWSQYRYSKTVPFRFAQVPGAHNALGKVKFLFPNEFSVYMHDTPTKGLFNRTTRAFSHGCIRLAKPIELLKTFSTFNTNVDFDKSQETLKGKNMTYLNLDNSVPIDVVYLTAWIDHDGKLQFRDDVYGYDEMQLKSYRNW